LKDDDFKQLTSNECPDEQSHSEDRHNKGLRHKEISQFGHMKVQEWQLNDDEQEERQQLRTCDVCIQGNVIREFLERRPNGFNHGGNTLPALKALGSKPFNMSARVYTVGLGLSDLQMQATTPRTKTAK
jgi:hypothetical protein